MRDDAFFVRIVFIEAIPNLDFERFAKNRRDD